MKLFSISVVALSILLKCLTRASQRVVVVALVAGLLMHVAADAGAASLTFNFSALYGTIQPAGPVSLNETDTQFLLVLKDWAREQWSRVRPRSVRPEQIEARTVLLAEEADLLYSFTTNYPASFWTPAIQLNLGRYYRRTGRYSRALELWSSAWEQTKSFPSGYVKELADSTLGSYLVLLAGLGRHETLDSVLTETENRRLPFGSDAQLYQQAAEFYLHMTLNPGKSYRCGTYALGRAADVLHGTSHFNSILRKIPSPSTGFTLQQLSDFSAQLGIGMVPVNWNNTPHLVVPSVVHWRENHYAAIIEQHGEWFKVVDPTIQEGAVMLRREDILAEADGYFLVPFDRIPPGWRTVGQQECASVYGRGYATGVGDGSDEPGCPVGSGPGSSGSPPGNGGGLCSSGACPGKAISAGPPGMPAWHVSEPYVNVWIFDTPLIYQPALGSEFAVNLMWRQRGLDMFTMWDPNKFTLLGGGWCFPWRSAIPQPTFDETGYANVGTFLPSGGHLYVEFSGGSSLSQHNYFNNTILERLVDGEEETGYSVHYPNGAQDVYGFIATNEFGVVNRYCLSSRIDPQGYLTQIDYFDYDPSQMNTVIERIIDADNHALTLTYTNIDLGYTEKTNFVSQITDWVGRTVKLRYETNYLQLVEIVDAANITNRFEYDGTSLTNMVTPYGATAFEHYNIRANHAETRYVTITEPNGDKHRYWYESADSQVPNVLDPLADGDVLPSGTPYDDMFVSNPTDRNTYYWDPTNYELLSTNFKNDPANNPPTSTDQLHGRGRHWLGTGTEGGAITHTIASERDPSPDGVVEGQITWFAYEGQAESSDLAGTQILPGVIARVLPNGSTGYTWYRRLANGNATNIVETYTKTDGNIGTRTNQFFYATNGIDLIKHIGPNGEQASSNSFNAYHQVLTNYNALNEATIYTYNGNRQLASIRQPSGLTTTNLYFTSGSTNRLDKTIDVEINRTNSYTYYTNGLIQTHTDERGMARNYTWDNLLRVTGITYPGGTTVSNVYTHLDLTGFKDRLNNWTYYGYDSIRRKIAETNANNVVTRYGYCECGSVGSITNAFGTAVQEVSNFNFDFQGNLITTVLPDGTISTNWYNLLRQLIVSGDAGGLRWFGYNNQGLLTVITNGVGIEQRTVFDIEDHPYIVTDANGVSITNTFDNLGRLRTRTYPDGGVEAFGYSANIAAMTSYTNQLNYVWTYAYDAAGRKTNEVGAGLYTNSFTYKPAGDLFTLKDGKNQVTTWNYDEYGRVTNKLDQASVEILRYKYDANSRLTNRWSKAKGDTAYSYDVVGNLTLVNYPAGTTDITLSYDALNRTTNMVDAAGTTKYTYSASGNLLTEDGPWSSDTVTYTYNSARLRSGLSLQQPTGTWTNGFTYDAAHRLTNVTSTAGTFSYAYKGAGNLWTNLALPNTSKITNSYDNVARLTGTYLLHSSGAISNKHEYLYNAGNQRIRHTRTDASYYTNTYDAIGQLKVADNTTASEDRFYGYDAAWNVSKRTNNATVYTFTVDQKNQLTNFNGTTYLYDSNGNLTSTAGWLSYDYDAENQLKSATYTTTTKIDFIHDGRGRLRKQIHYTWNGSSWVAGTTVAYVYDGMRVIQERDSGNTPTVAYTRGSDLSGSPEGAGGIGGMLGRSHSLVSGSFTNHNYYHADGGGNVTYMVNTNQSMVATYKYDPYGNLISTSGSLAGANVYRFSSKEWISWGFYYYGYRFYDPNLQRWLNRDPLSDYGWGTKLAATTSKRILDLAVTSQFLGTIENRGEVNLYSFTLNDPNNRTDSFGLEASDSQKAICGIVCLAACDVCFALVTPRARAWCMAACMTPCLSYCTGPGGWPDIKGPSCSKEQFEHNYRRLPGKFQ